jgi:Tol biopolymer transport system component
MLIKKYIYIIVVFQLILNASLNAKPFSGVSDSINHKIIKTLHFDIYYPESMSDLAGHTAKIAEESYVYLANYLKHELNVSVSLIIDPGNTELNKDIHNPDNNADRIELSFKGSYSLYHEELTHLLVHSFQYDVLYNSSPGWIISYASLSKDYPTQIIEGSALFLSEGYDEQSDIIIRDLIVSGKADKYFDINKLNYYNKNKLLSDALYKSFYFFLETEIAQDIFADLFLNIKNNNDFHEAIEIATGMSIITLNGKWISFYKRRFATVSENNFRDNIKEIPLDQVNNGIPVAALNAAFTENDLLFLQKIDSRIGFLKIRSSGKENNILLYQHDITFLRSQDYYSTKYYPSLSSDNKYVIFTKKSGMRNIFSLYDKSQRKKITDIILPFRSIRDASISSDGKSIVFSGQSYSSTDLFIYNIANKSLRRITSDLFSERYPEISSDSSFIVYSSNENAEKNIESKKYKIIKLDLKTGVKSTIADSNVNNTFPDISRDDKNIIYASDISGTYKIYNYNTENQKISMITNNSADAFFARWLPDGSGIVAVSYKDFKCTIFVKFIDNTEIIKYNAAERPVFKYIKYPEPYFAMEDIVMKDYSSGKDLQISYDISGVVLDNGFAGTAGIKLEDPLRVQELSINYEFLKYGSDRNSNYYLDYKFSKYHPEIDFGSFYISNPLRTNYFWDEPTIMFYPNNIDARNNGIYASFSYPFAKGFSAALKGISVIYENLVNTKKEYSDFYSNELSVSLKFDSLILRPVAGTKCELSYSRSFDGRVGDLSFDKIFFNLFNIFRFNDTLALTTNAAGGRISGQDRDFFKFYEGGPDSVRGHDLFSFSGKNAAIFNLELQVTVLKRLTLRWPAEITFNNICLALFADFGSAWNEDYSLINSETGEFADLKSGLGAGLRFYMLDHIAFKLDAAWQYYYKSFGKCNIVSGFETRF